MKTTLSHNNPDSTELSRIGKSNRPDGNCKTKAYKEEKKNNKKKHGKGGKNTWRLKETNKNLAESVQDLLGKLDGDRMYEEKLCEESELEDEKPKIKQKSQGDYLNMMYPYYRLHFMIHGVGPKAVTDALGKATLLCSRLGVDKSPYDWSELSFRAISKSALELPVLRVEKLNMNIYNAMWWHKWATRVCIGVGSISATIALILTRHRPMLVSSILGLTVCGFIASRLRYRHILGGVAVVDVPTLVDYCVGPEPVPIDLVKIAGSKCWFEPAKVPRCTPVKHTVCFSIALDHVYKPRGCSHNVQRALCHRQLLGSIGIPAVRSDLWHKARVALEDELKLPFLERGNYLDLFEAWLGRSSYNDERKKLMRRSLEANNNGAYLDTRVQARVKYDEILMGKDVGERDPRCITTFTETLLVRIAPEYSALQHECVEQLWPDACTALQQRFIYTGCMTPDEIGYIVSYMEHHRMHAYEGDFSRYDGHTEEEAITAELDFYKPYLSTEVLDIMRNQCQTKGRTRCAASYACLGKMSSGAINTSFGNTLRNFMIACLFMKTEYPEVNYYYMAIGDDNVMFCPVELDIELWKSFCTRMGHILEVVYRSPDSYNFLEYCSCRFWNCGGVRIMGPKIGRVFAKSFVSVKMRKDPLAHAKGVAACYKYYRFLPGIDILLKSLGSDATEIVDYYNPHKILLRHEVDVDQTAVDAMFWDVYGVEPDLFRELCKRINWHEMGKSYRHWMFEDICLADGIIKSRSFQFLPLIDFYSKIMGLLGYENFIVT